MFRTPTALLLTVGFTAIVLVNNAYVVWAPAFVEEKFGLSVTLAGGYSMFYHHLAALVGVLIGGRLSDVARRSPPPVPPGTADRRDALGRAGDPLDGTRRQPDGNVDRDGHVRFLPRAVRIQYARVVVRRHPAAYRASAVGVMVMLAFLAGSGSPWLLGQCRELVPNHHGLSYGFAALSAAYLLGGLAVLAALKFTFVRDYCEEATPP